MPKGVAYSPDEDAIIVRAAISARSDPVVGSDLKKPQYNAKIYEAYKRLATEGNIDAKTIDERTADGVRQRYKKLKELYKRFHALYIRVEETVITGIHTISKDEKIKMALLLYDGKARNPKDAAHLRAKNSSQDRVDVFEDTKCWMIFRDTPGFTSERLGNLQAESVSVDAGRPMGRKRAKQQTNGNDLLETGSAAASAANRIVDFLESKRQRTEKGEQRLLERELALNVANYPNIPPDVSRQLLVKLAGELLKQFEDEDTKPLDVSGSCSDPSSSQSFPSADADDVPTDNP